MGRFEVSTSQWIIPLLFHAGLSSRAGGFMLARSRETQSFSSPQISAKAWCTLGYCRLSQIAWCW